MSYPLPEPPGAPDTEPLRTVFVREAIVQYRGQGRTVEAPIQEPYQAVALARKTVTDHAREHFQAVYLNGRHRPIGHSIVSIGTATTSLVHPREIFQTAILGGAVALIILHNHPSGDPKPSREDEAVTKRLSDAGELLGIRLLDSIVWTHESAAYYSFQEERPGVIRTPKPSPV